MPQVKVTNITHNNPEKPGHGFGCWFMDKFIHPGDAIIIDMGQLPSNWRQLTNIFRYEEIPEPHMHQPDSPAHTALLERLLIQQAALLEEMQAMKGQIGEQKTVIYQPVPGTPTLPKAQGPQISQEIYVGEIADVQTSEIQIESVDHKGSSADEVRAKMAKLKEKKQK